jgi:hypothetical protein
MKKYYVLFVFFLIIGMLSLIAWCTARKKVVNQHNVTFRRVCFSTVQSRL